MPASASPASPRKATSTFPANAQPGPAKHLDFNMLIAVAIVVMVLDRITKMVVQHNLPLGDHAAVLGDLLWIDHTQNTGIAFSVARTQGGVVFVFDIIAILFIAYLARRAPSGEPWLRVGLGLVLGGAIGNVIDRVLAGSVTDFIDFRVFPVFNVADIGITIGALIIAWRLWSGSRKEA